MDAKGRVILPTKIVPTFQLADKVQLYITLGDQDHLIIFDSERANQFEQDLLALNGSKKNVAAVQKYYLGNMQMVEADSNNRILLPKALRQMINLERNVTLICLKTRYELWSAEKFIAFSKTPPSMEDAVFDHVVL